MMHPSTELGELKVERALVSVFDKRGVVDFARSLNELGVEIISTGGTAAAIEEAGIDTTAIEEYTGFPEMLDGRVKTLHPNIFAGLLAVRSSEEHRVTLAEHGIAPIDLVVVNLYPFERTAARRGVTEEEVIEHIDIGGPTLIRAAAKNHAFVGVLVRPESYDAVIEELQETGGLLSAQTRESLATEAFGATARYDAAISRWFAEREEDFPNHFVAAFEKLLDLDSGRRLLREFELPACAIIKHNNPCGVGVGETALEAYERALACDPTSAYGGVVVFNREVDRELGAKLNENFVELIFAPGYEHEAIEIIRSKPHVRVIEDSERRKGTPGERDMRKVAGGLIVQDADVDIDDRAHMDVVTERKPTEDEWGELLFAWKVCKHVRSNAIVLANGLATIGIGAGQMSRVDSVRLAVEKARENRADQLQGSAMASDAFFPFADGVEAAIEAGVTAVIQPGGSRRDPEVIEAANRAGIAMVFTGRRHFRH